jgi:nucleolar protein 14
MFNLEDEEGEEEMVLTHMGQSLSFGNENPADDFMEEDLDRSDDDLSADGSARKRKRIVDPDEVDDMEGLADEDDEENAEDGQPERKKSKAEVMKEVIAKSKLYKYERQKAKEDDDDLRAELDKGLPDLFELMRGSKLPPKPEPPKDDATLMNPERAALLEGKDKDEADVEYDRRLKQMAYDKRSQPTDRTKTEEEKVQEEAERLKTLEAERLRRMRGEDDSQSDVNENVDQDEEDELMPDDAKTFGLAQATNEVQSRSELGVEDEDDFIIDDDLVESDSDASLSFIQSDDEDLSGDDEDSENDQEDEEDEMINDFVDSSGNAIELKSASGVNRDSTDDHLAYTYPCPETHEQFLEVIKNVTDDDLPVVVQRIRALYHSRLHSDNKTKLGYFATVLVEHVAYMANQPTQASYAIIENLLRHIHSMAKSNSEVVAKAFRAHLRKAAAERPLSLLPGDLVILTGVLTIFPTSDHFHAVVTPANLCLARYLGQSAVVNLSDLVTGAYAASLAVQYQTLAKRFIPELMNYCLNSLSILSPTKIEENLGGVLFREPEQSLRLTGSSQKTIQKLQFSNTSETNLSPESTEDLKISLIETFVSVLDAAAELWNNKSAFPEIFKPAQTVLQHLRTSCGAKQIPSSLRKHLQSSQDKITQLSSQAHLARRPLLLHSHRPLAIKTSIPKFEENFNPDRHYDANRERAELNRLKKEHKRERKGALRELRKDAHFIARESLRDKKERDAAYEKKYKRLIAEIQGEEGREAKAYDREKKSRQGNK